MEVDKILVGLNNYLILVGQWILSSGVRIIFICILLAVGLRASHWISSKFFLRIKPSGIEGSKRIRTVQNMIGVIWKSVVMTVGAMLVLGELGINLGPILATAGIVGLAVGFGAQELVKDVISGFFILLEDQIRVGDVVNVNDKGGLVEKVNIRTIVLRDLDGTVHFIRNGQINLVSNMTKEFSYYVFNLRISYNDDVDKVITVLRQVDEQLRSDPNFASLILRPIEILGVDSYEESYLILKARTKTLPIQQWNVGREFNKRLKSALSKAGIKVPYPTRNLNIPAWRADSEEIDTESSHLL